MTKISVIVPVYNAEQYLRRCVESILSQTYEDIELLLVDDGSLDASGEICDSFANKDHRIKVIHQKNAGVSAARNVGLMNASGEYIGFVDADDYIEPTMFQTLVYTAERDDAEMVICDAMAISEINQVEIETFHTLAANCTLSKEQIEPKHLLEMAGAVWRCLYRTKLIRDNQLQFPIGLKIAEDRIFNLYAIGACQRVSYVKQAYYFRVLLETSTVHKYHQDYYETVKRAKDETQRALNISWGGEQKFLNAFLQQYVYASIMAIENLKHKDSGLSYIKRIENIHFICRDIELQNAIQVTNYTEKDVKSKWILNCNLIALNMRSMRLYWILHAIQSVFKREGFRGIMVRIVRKR